MKINHPFIEIDADSQCTPIYMQIVEAICEKIASGILKPGSGLPSTRKMAGQLHVSRKTVITAMEILQARGKLVSKDRVGLFVAQSPAKARTEPSYRLVVNDGFPDTRLLPFREFSRSYRKLFNRAALWHNLGYNSPAGYPKLVEYIAGNLRRSCELPIGDDELCVVRGAQMALFLVANAILGRGEHVAVESPGYHNAYKTFRRAGLQVHEIPVDEDGLDTGMLERLCGKVDLKAVYLTPRHQYPTTVKLSPKRRRHVRELSEKYGFIVIEDDFGAEFQFSGRHLLPLSAMLDKGRYIYIGTFSKIFAPAVRVGYIASDSATVGRIADYRSLIDIHGDSVAEHALCELYENNEMQRHIRRTSRVYRERLNFFCGEMKKAQGGRVSFRKPHGGLAVWLKLDVPASAAALKREFENKGISVPVFPLPGGGAGLRIGYASLSADETKELVAAVDSVVKSF